MGNCANKPLTTEGDAPVEEVAETKATTTTTTIEEREIGVDQNKVSSLAQMLENDDGKKPEAEGATKTTDEKASEPPKIEQVTKEVAVETKKEEASKPAADEPKKEEAKPAASEPRKEETKPVVAPAPAAATAPAPAPAAATAEKK